MANEVIVGNVGGNDGVASEATLAALLRAMERMGNQTGKKSTRDKTQELANKAITAGTTEQKKQTDQVKDNTNKLKDATEKTKEFGKSLGNMALAGFGSVMSSLGAMTKELLNGNDSMEAYASKIPVVGGLLGALAGYADRSVSAFREMSTVGANFNNDIGTMRKAAAEANLSLDEFSSLITRNSANLALLGTSVAGGVARFTAISKAMKDTGDFEALKAMGFSVTEVNQGLSDYTALQARLGRLQGKSNTELASGAATYLKELDQLSKLTGKSRAEMAALQAQQANDAGFRALESQFAKGSQELANFRRSMALIETLPANVANGLKDLADGIPQTEDGIALITAAGPRVAQAMQEVARGANPQVLLDAMKAAGGQIEGFAGATGEQRKRMIDAFKQSNPALAGVLDAANRMTNLGIRSLAEVEQQQSAESATTKKLTTFQDSIRRVSEALQVAFVDSGILNLFATGVGAAARMITGMADSIKAFTEKFKAEGFVSALVGVLGDTVKGLFTNAPVVAALVAGITALFLGKAALSAMSSAMSGWAERSIGRMFGGGAAGAATQAPNALAGAGRVQPSTAGAGFGAAIGNISKGIGTGVEAVLTGLANGLAAFGKVGGQILIGAAAIGATILLIGGSIAGATWIMGKALPTFAEGLKSFADIDGANLLKVGLGIGAVGAAMAAMGAGSAIGAVGGMLGGLANGITSLFGGSTPFDKLEEFSRLNIDAVRVENNANAVVAYSKAMAALGAGGAVGAIGGLVTAAAEGLTRFFGGSTTVPWDKVQAFQNINLDAPKIKSNAEAVTAFGQAMSALPATSSGERTSGLIDSVAGFFLGAKSTAMPWDQMVAFGNLRLPTASIKANAEAMAAFGEALSKVPEVKKERTGGLMSAVSSFFNGDSISVLPWAQLETFGNLRLPTASIKANAEAMAAFGEALSKVPEVRSERTSGLMGAIASFFGGSQVMPWDKVAEFGNARINATAVESNAKAMTAFGNAITAFQGGSSSSKFPEIPTSLVYNLERLGNIGSAGGLTATAQGLQAIANTQNLTSTLTALNALDASKLLTYNTALKELTKTLAKLNEELANENKGGLFGGGASRANAGDALKAISVNTSAGAGSTDQLNSIMTQVLDVLRQMKDLNDKIEKNTKNMGGSDISSRNVTVY